MSFNKAAYLRYIAIDACIGNKYKPYPSMQDLIDACERKLDKAFTVSTIQKDIKDLKEGVMGVEAPIRFKKSQNGYYYTDPDFTIRKLGLQDSEIEALKASADMLTVFSGSRVSENFNTAVDKIFASLHERLHLRDNGHRIIQMDSATAHKGFEHFEFFLHSAQNRIPVCFVHYSYKNRKFKSVIVHPIILKEFQNNWYVVGYSESHREIRTFGLDRIYDPLLLKKEFIEPSSKQRENYFRHIYGVYPLDGHPLQEIEFIVNPFFSDYLHAHPIHESQQRKEELVNGHAVYRLELIPSQELINFFMSFSQHLMVKKPQWIYQQIQDMHHTAMNHEKTFGK